MKKTLLSEGMSTVSFSKSLSEQGSVMGECSPRIKIHWSEGRAVGQYTYMLYLIPVTCLVSTNSLMMPGDQD